MLCYILIIHFELQSSPWVCVPWIWML